MGSLDRVTLAFCAFGVISATIASPGAAGPRSEQVERCQLARFTVAVGPYISEATEQHTLALRLVSHAQRLCVLDGYPAVTFFDARGAMNFRIRHSGDQMISARPPIPVRVRPGGRAFVLVNKNACVEKSLRSATRMELRTPSGGSTSFTFPAQMPLAWRVPYSCLDARDPGQTITVSPFVPSVRAALNA